jgi:hypothetical protein
MTNGAQISIYTKPRIGFLDWLMMPAIRPCDLSGNG